MTLLGFVLLAFTRFGEEAVTGSKKFKVSSERVSVFTATEILLMPFEPLIGFWDFDLAADALDLSHLRIVIRFALDLSHLRFKRTTSLQ